MTVQPRVLVSTATFNETSNLRRLVREIHRYLREAEILITDDNSPDGTGRLADELAANDSRIHVHHREGKLGLGTAVVTAMRYAIAHDYDFFITIDADLSHHPKYLPALVAGMQDYDITIGSRYVAGGGTKNWPWRRRLMSKGVNTLVRFLMRVPARDTSGGYRCHRVACLKRLDFDRIISSGYSFFEELLYRCWKAGCRIGEIPIIFEERTCGASKANVKEMLRSLSILLYLGIRSMFGRG